MLMRMRFLRGICEEINMNFDKIEEIMKCFADLLHLSREIMCMESMSRDIRKIDLLSFLILLILFKGPKH